jgi:dienelactone hydrolase
MRILNWATLITSLVISVSGIPRPAHADQAFDVLRSYYDVDSHLPLGLEITAERQDGRHHITEFAFAAFDNEPVRARLERPDPDRFSGPRPVAILLHGITQSLDQWWRTDDGAYSFPSAHRARLVDQGFAVLAIDLRNHGARMQPHDFKAPSDYLTKGYLEAARKMISQSALDVRRTIDTVGQFDGLDPNRISVVGFSLGAWTGYIAAAIDDRVSSAVLIGMPFLAPVEGNGTHFISQFEYIEGLDGRPVHFIAGTEDTFYTRDVVENLVGAIGSAATVSWLESGHDFPRSTADLTVAHLTKGN